MCIRDRPNFESAARKSCRSQKMMQNAYLLAKIGADTVENERHFAEILPKIGTDPTRPPDSVSPLILLILLRSPWSRGSPPADAPAEALAEPLSPRSPRSPWSRASPLSRRIRAGLPSERRLGKKLCFFLTPSWNGFFASF